MKQEVVADSARLVGWLVSYAMDQMGKAFEIRSGRTLISAEDGSGTTIRLKARDVSAPHLAMKATDKHELIAQDIFSDEGSYLERAGNGEKAIDGPVALKHGDWLRIGEKTRFQVCLIEGVKR